MTVENKIFAKIILCIIFLIFYSDILHCQSVEEVVIIEKFEDNTTDPIDSLYTLENRRNSLNISKEKRHFLHQSDENLHIDKAEILGNALATKIENIKSPKKFSAIAASKTQFIQDSHSAHFGLIETPNFQIYTGLMTNIKKRFYTIAKPSIKVSAKSRIFFPFAFNYNYNTDNFTNTRLGMGFSYNHNNLSVVTTAMAVLDENIDKPEFIGGIEAVNQLQWKNIVNQAEIFITNKRSSFMESFTFKQDFFMFCAESNFTVEYEKPLFSMSHSITAGFNLGNAAIFVRSYTDNKENDIE